MYEYKCADCGAIFELIQKFSDEPLTKHTNGCGGPVERLISAPALQFKGSGWYVTDYAKGSTSRSNGASKAESSASGDAKAKTESKTETKTESKPAAAPAASTTPST